jgi:hypothetical protein
MVNHKPSKETNRNARQVCPKTDNNTTQKTPSNTLSQAFLMKIFRVKGKLTVD